MGVTASLSRGYICTVVVGAGAAEPFNRRRHNIYGRETYVGIAWPTEGIRGYPEILEARGPPLGLPLLPCRAMPVLESDRGVVAAGGRHWATFSAIGGIVFMVREVEV
jgi:hypothetical protein